MVKGGKRYSSMSNDGKWFAHAVLKENETKTRETCTSTGIMLAQIESSLPQALRFERYPKWKAEQKARDRFSDHDNKYTLKDNISVFSQGVGRKKCLDDRRQHNSHFCLCHNGADRNIEDTASSLTAYQGDFKAKASVGLPTENRRFTHNHQQKSAEAALVREQSFWFGRDDSVPPGGPPELLVAAK